MLLRFEPSPLKQKQECYQLCLAAPFQNNKIPGWMEPIFMEAKLVTNGLKQTTENTDYMKILVLVFLIFWN